MRLFEGKVILSASTLHVYMTCPRMFKYLYEDERFSDRIFSKSLIVHRYSNVDILTKNKEMTQISLDTQLQNDVLVSASSLGMFKKCPKSFEYRYTKTPQSDPVDITPYQFGILVHKRFDAFVADVLSRYGSLLNSPFKEEFVKFYTSDQMKEEILAKINSNDSWTESKQAVFSHFYESIKNHYKFISSILDKGCEPHFNFWFGRPNSPLALPKINISRLLVIGEIDHFYENTRGNLTIEDTKTSQSTFYLDYDQLHLYALALEQVYENRGTPKKVDELNFNLVRKGYRHPIPFGKEQRDSLIANLSALETSIELNEFRRVKGVNCSRCAWRTLCQRQVSRRTDAQDSFLEQLKNNVKDKEVKL